MHNIYDCTHVKRCSSKPYVHGYINWPLSRFLCQIKFCRIKASQINASHVESTFKLACLAVTSTPSRNLSAAALSWLIPSLLLKPMEPEVSRHNTVSKGILKLAETGLLAEVERKTRALHKHPF